MANVIVQTYAVSLFEVAQEEKKEEIQKVYILQLKKKPYMHIG